MIPSLRSLFLWGCIEFSPISFLCNKSFTLKPFLFDRIRKSNTLWYLIESKGAMHCNVAPTDREVGLIIKASNDPWRENEILQKLQMQS